MWVRRLAAFAGAALVVVALAASAGAAGPAAGGLAEHAEPVADYTLRATLDPSLHTVHGEGTLRWTNRSHAPVQEVWVHLYLNAFKNQRSTFLSEPVGGFRGTEAVRDWGTIDVRRFALRGAGAEADDLWPRAELRRPGSEDETDARVPLPRAVAPGESVTFELAWDDKLPSIVERTGYLDGFHMVAQWFPKIARLEPDGSWAHFPFHHLAEFYADFGTYDVTLDVPTGVVVGATGPRVEAHDAGGRHVERHLQADVHDFAWTAWDRFEQESETIDGVQVTALFPPGYRYVAHRELASMRFGLPHFREAYGPYPYTVLTLVHPPDRAREAGGMEYPTLITTGGPWYGPPGILGVEDVTLHEFGHQYFYGLLASNEVLWPFLDEGLNSFAEQRALGAWQGAGSLVQLLGLQVSDTAVHAAFGRRGAHEQPIAQPAYAFGTGSAYGSLVYNRTSTVFETFRRTYGSDVTFALGAYARKFRFEHPTPDDLIASFGDTLGLHAAETLRRALFDKGWVNYKVLDVESRRARAPSGIFDGANGRETVSATPSEDSFEGGVLVAHEGTLAFPVDIELTREDGARERVHWDGEGADFRIPFRGPSPLTAAVVDPDHAVLLDEHPHDNFAQASGAPSRGAPRSFERLLYWASLVLQTLGS